MKIILNKQYSIHYLFYTIVESKIDMERILTDAFYNSQQHKQQLKPVEQFGRIIIDDDFSAYHRITLVPNTFGWVEQRNVPLLRRRQKPTGRVERHRVPRQKTQGWEILDDITFMSYNQQFAQSNMHRVIPTHGQRLQTKPIYDDPLPSLEEAKKWLEQQNPLATSKDAHISLPPGFANQHKAKIVEEINKLGDQATYTPKIRSIAKIAPFLKWNSDYDLTTKKDVTDKDTPSMEELIPSLVTESIANMDFLKLLKCDTTLIASAITSSVLAIGTSLHTLYTTEPTTTSKVLNSVAIVSSLTTFCLAIHKLFERYGIANNTTDIYSQLPALAKNILSSDIKSNSLVWIYPAVATLISIVIGALTAFQICDVKAVIEKGRLLQSAKAFGSTATDVTKFLLEDLAGLDVTGDQKAFDELHAWAKRSSELSVKSVMEFIQDAELNNEIHAAVKTTLPIITNKYLNKDLSHTARSAYQLILANISKLQEKVEAIKIIGDACKRIETFGVFFGGKKGLGKSRLCSYIANYIANIMGLPTTLYNLNKSKDTGFYAPYGGAAFAEIQEFMALKDQDPNLAHINQIISGDHFNLESAHLSGKQQPFNARIVFLTSNNLCPDLLRVLEKEAARATWDRILRFEVIDEAVQGRTGLNAHRRPDFSHLRFNFVTTTDEPNAANLQKQPVTINEVLGIILYQTALREHQFISSGLNAQVLNDEDTEKRRKFLKDIIDRNTQANSGQDFNILRIEGPQFTGKTRLADQISSYIHGLLPTWPLVKVQALEETFLPITAAARAIYIIDDLIETNATSYQHFLKWINAGHPDNLYIICTNHTYPQKWRRNIFYKATTPYWEVNTHGCSSGIARRLGLEGEMQCSDGSSAFASSRSTQVFIGKPGSIFHLGEEKTLSDLKNMVFTKFHDYLKCKEIVTVRHESYTETSFDFDCVVKLKTYDHVSKAFKNITSVTKARLGLVPGVSLSFKTALIPDITRHFKSQAQLLPGIVKCRTTLLEQAEAICVILNRAIPGLSARFIIEETGDDLILKDRVLYVGYNMTPSILNVTHSATNQNITFTFMEETRVVTYHSYANFLKTGIIPSELQELPPEVISRLNMYVTDNIKDSIFSYNSFLAEIQIAKQQFVEQNFTTFIRNKPVVTLITALLALTTTGAVIALIAKAFSSKNDTIANSTDDENDMDPKVSVFAQRMKRAVLEGEDQVREVRREVSKAGLEREFNRWENDWRSGKRDNVSNYLPIAIEKGNVKEIIALCTLNPIVAADTLKKIHGNMLSIKDEKHQLSGPLEQLAEKLRKNYVHVNSKVGNLYGLIVKGNLGITVAHCVDDNATELEISSNGQVYKANICKISRDRDLLTFRILDKTFPSACDITQLFPRDEDMYDLTSGWYVRPTTRPLIINAPIEYIDRHATPLMDNNNPYFRVEGKSWKYRLTGIATCASTFKIGDCGFPLIGIKKNLFYIIGIHNAFSIAQMGWFASVTQADIQEISANVAPVRAALTIRHPLLNENMVIDDNLHKLVMTPYKTSQYEGVSPLKIHGYNVNLLFRSFPKHKKTHCEVAGKYLTCQTTGSALDASQVEDFTNLYPDKRGAYYPLFTQAVKYALTQEREESFDPVVDAHVSDFLKNYYQKHYQSDKILKPHEIINGLINLKPLDMTTSAGPKMKKIFNINTKRPEGNENVLFINTSKTEKPWYVINTETPAGGALLSDFSHYMSMIKQGKPICCVVKDNAKVELLPIEKVKKGKVRLFNEMDLSLNMVLKSYFGPMLEKIMENHDKTFFCIGMNPYKDATAHMLYFNNMDGEFINADFESLDKTVTAHLIKDFVDCTLPHISQPSREALYKTLTYRLHSMNGNVYFVDNGNASGSFVTTLLNCHVVAKTTLYTFARKYKEEFGILPSYLEITDNIIIRGLGDDAIRKVRNIFKEPITQEHFIADALRYKLKQTPAKTEGEVSFCSREYVKYKNVYFPRLKQSSITSSLFWFRNLQPELIYQNCFAAIMEAGLWDKEFFSKVVKAVIQLANTFKFKIDLASYELVQQCWYDYIRGEKISPVWGRSNPETIFDIQSNSESTFLKMADMWLNEYVQKNKLEQPVYKYAAEGPDDRLLWSCKVSLLDNEQLFEGEGSGEDKSTAKREACEEVRQHLSGVESNIEVEWLCYKHLGVEYHTDKCKRGVNKGGIFNSEVAFIRYIKDEFPAVNFLEKQARKELMATKCITSVKVAIEGYINKHLLPKLKKCVEEFTDTICDKENITRDEMVQLDSLLGKLESLQVKSNVGDMPIEPAMMNQAMNAQSASELPSQSNPQPTAMAPALTAPGDDIMSAIQIAQETTMNPMGAPNMLSVGAIGFDVKMLIYEQYLDCDTEFSTTESAPTGAVILQIPYAVISQFTNYYIKTYASLHKRYTGSLKFRITGIGNQLLSGAIGACWREERTNESTILISEAQKIAYEMKGVNNPFNEIHTLHDARQSLFYRNVADDLTDDMATRPHLVLFVGMNVYNPYRDNTLVRFRIASKLSNGREPNPFFFALPTRGLPDLSVAASTTVAASRPFNDTFTQTINHPINIYTDGSLRNGVEYEDGESYLAYSSKAVNNAAWKYTHNGVYTQSAMSTTTSSVLDNTSLFQNWRRIHDFFLASGVTPTSTVVSVISQSTMDSKHFAILTASAAYPGFGTYATNVDGTNAQWDFLKATQAWRIGEPPISHMPQTNIQIRAILYNDTEISLGQLTTHDNHKYFYMRAGQIKIITNFGTAYYYLVATATNTAPAVATLRRNAGLLSQFTEGTGSVVTDLASYPNFNVDTSLGALPGFVSLPLGYQALRFSDIPASALTIDDYPGPTATDESVIERWFANRARGLAPTACLEMTLVDNTSQRIAMTVRYFSEWRIFVINAETPNYRTFPITTANLNIQSIVEIERTNAFPVTDTSLWFARTSTLAFDAMKQLTPGVDFEEVTSNAALAIGAGVLGGLGQSLNQIGARKHEKEMQGNTFGHELTMQGNMFEQQGTLQGNQFGHEQRMATMNNAFLNMMQNHRFGQEKEMTVLQANETRATNRLQSQNRMVERGLGTRTNFLNTSFSTTV